VKQANRTEERTGSRKNDNKNKPDRTHSKSFHRNRRQSARRGSRGRREISQIVQAIYNVSANDRR